jgi:hypothetical protein
VSGSYSPRIRSFRDEIIKTLPRVPNNRLSLEEMQALPTRKLISAYVTWRMRYIPAKPRLVRLWSGGVTPMQFQAAKPKLFPLLKKVAAGDDLTPHLSELVGKKGIILPSARNAGPRQDIDAVLTRHGLHHFHAGVVTRDNPKGRSGSLVFAEVLESEFRIVAIANHEVFKSNSPERLRFIQTCLSYTAKDIPPGQGFMPNPVMSSGHSMLVIMFGRKCEDEISRLDPLLDDSTFIDKLYREQPIVRDGTPVPQPKNSAMAWHFDDLRFGILDRQSTVFFCLFPFFSR